MILYKLSWYSILETNIIQRQHPVWWLDPLGLSHHDAAAVEAGSDSEYQSVVITSLRHCEQCCVRDVEA